MAFIYERYPIEYAFAAGRLSGSLIREFATGRTAKHKIERGVLYAGVKSTVHHKTGRQQQRGPVILADSYNRTKDIVRVLDCMVPSGHSFVGDKRWRGAS